MSKFKVGDIVTYRDARQSCHEGELELLGIYPDSQYSSHKVRQLSGEHWTFSVTEESLDLVRKGDPMNNLKQGDVLVNKGRKDWIVQSVTGEVVLVIQDDTRREAFIYSVTELKDAGWKLKGTEEPTELSIDEIAKKFNLKPEQVRIKKEG